MLVWFIVEEGFRPRQSYNYIEDMKNKFGLNNNRPEAADSLHSPSASKGGGFLNSTIFIFSFVLLVLTGSPKQTYSQSFHKCDCEYFDSLKVFVIGDHFSGKKYRFVLNSKVIHEIFFKGKNVIDTFSIPIEIKLKDRIPGLKIFKLDGNKWVDMNFKLLYLSYSPYLIIYQDNRMKKKYEFNYFYTYNRPGDI